MGVDLKSLPPAYQQQAQEQLNALASPRPWTAFETSTLIAYYSENSPNFSLATIASELHRTHSAVACKADDLGLCLPLKGPKRPCSKEKRRNLSIAQEARHVADPSLGTKITSHLPKDGLAFLGRKHTDESRSKMSLGQKAHLAEHGHARGMLGRHHTLETRAAISKIHTGRIVPRERVIRSLKTKVAKYGSLAPVHFGTSWKQGWREIGGVKIYARSRWEANYARYLEWLRSRGEISKWEHEPETFWFEKVKRGCVSYLPDFKITTPAAVVYYVEVKGWMCPRSITKIRRMRMFHPEVDLRIVDAAWFKNNRTIASMIPEWESMK